MGKLREGKELRNLLRLARYFPGTNVFGANLSELGASQIDALILVMNKEMQEMEDRSKGPNTKVYRFDDDDEVKDDLPDEV